MKSVNIFENVSIPVYIINLPARKDRLIHIQQQFAGKDEFDLNIVEAIEDENGAIGLWKSIVKIIKMAKNNQDDVIVICEDDHEFTCDYSKNYFLHNVIEANDQGANLLIGGVSSFGQAIPVSEYRYWVDRFFCTQFIVVYSGFFNAILEEKFGNRDAADLKLSIMTSNKMVLHPFVSIQKEFGYSDISPNNKRLLSEGTVPSMFEAASTKLAKIRAIQKKYVGIKSQNG